jgi:Zyg-11 family protein
LQLQQKSLLVLDHDNMLKNVEFNKRRCASLVMDCLCEFDDPCMNEMGAGICLYLGKLAG